MAELQRVRPPSLVDRHLGALVRLLLVIIAVAVAKPWAWGGDAGSNAVTPPPTSAVSLASPAATPPPPLGFEDLVYDRTIFGLREPTPAWGLWPAAFLVTFGFVFQMQDGSPFPSPATIPGTIEPSASGGNQAPVDGGPSWPSQFTPPPGYHLFLIGINMPKGFSLRSATLLQVDAGANPAPVELKYLDSPWPDHFAVIGIPGPAATDRLSVWAPGDYRLTLVFDPGVSRTIEILLPIPPGLAQPT
jgi:hypothetical protein